MVGDEFFADQSENIFSSCPPSRSLARSVKTEFIGVVLASGQWARWATVGAMGYSGGSGKEGRTNFDRATRAKPGTP